MWLSLLQRQSQDVGHLNERLEVCRTQALQLVKSQLQYCNKNNRKFFNAIKYSKILASCVAFGWISCEAYSVYTDKTLSFEQRVMNGTALVAVQPYHVDRAGSVLVRVANGQCGDDDDILIGQSTINTNTTSRPLLVRQQSPPSLCIQQVISRSKLTRGRYLDIQAAPTLLNIARQDYSKNTKNTNKNSTNNDLKYDYVIQSSSSGGGGQNNNHKNGHNTSSDTGAAHRLLISKGFVRNTNNINTKNNTSKHNKQHSNNNATSYTSTSKSLYTPSSQVSIGVFEKLNSLHSWSNSASQTYSLHHNNNHSELDSDEIRTSNATQQDSHDAPYRIDVTIVDGRSALLVETVHWICSVIDRHTAPEVESKVEEVPIVTPSAESESQDHNHHSSDDNNALLTALDTIGRSLRLVVEYTQLGGSHVVQAVSSTYTALTTPSVAPPGPPVIYIDGCVAGSGVHHSVSRQLQTLGFEVKIVESPAHLQSLVNTATTQHGQATTKTSSKSITQIALQNASLPPVLVLLLPSSLADTQNNDFSDVEMQFKTRAYCDSSERVHCCCIVHSNVGDVIKNRNKDDDSRNHTISLLSVTSDCWDSVGNSNW
eukprot:gene22046-28140_t